MNASLRKACLVLPIILIGDFMVARAIAAPAPGLPTNAPATEVRPPARTDYSAFKIVAERNIFDANRTGRQSGGTRERRRVAKVDSFSLVGTLSNEKGYRALFDGSSPEFRKDLALNGTIAGFKVTTITLQGARLENNGQNLDLRLGMQMRREDEGEWKLNASGESIPATGRDSSISEHAASASSSSSAATGDASDVLKRLMQQREQELK